MSHFRLCHRVFTFAAILLACAGCNEVDLPSLDQVFHDPPSRPLDDPFATPCPTYPNPNCPDGRCPIPDYQSAETFGHEVESAGSHPVNTEAAEEVKSQCPTCPQSTPSVRIRRPTSVPYTTRAPNRYSPVPLAPGEIFLGWGSIRPATPQYLTPSTMPRPATPAVIDCPDCELSVEKPREGAFACQRCKRKTVGSQWHELWADDGTPLTCLCESCWQSITPSERRSHLEAYARRSIRGGVLSPITQQAIGQAVGHTYSSPPAQSPSRSYGKEF